MDVIVAAIIAAVVGLAIGIGAGYFVRKNISEAKSSLTIYCRSIIRVILYGLF